MKPRSLALVRVSIIALGIAQAAAQPAAHARVAVVDLVGGKVEKRYEHVADGFVPRYCRRGAQNGTPFEACFGEADIRAAALGGAFVDARARVAGLDEKIRVTEAGLPPKRAALAAAAADVARLKDYLSSMVLTDEGKARILKELAAAELAAGKAQGSISLDEAAIAGSRSAIQATREEFARAVRELEAQLELVRSPTELSLFVGEAKLAALEKALYGYWSGATATYLAEASSWSLGDGQTTFPFGDFKEGICQLPWDWKPWPNRSDLYPHPKPVRLVSPFGEAGLKRECKALGSTEEAREIRALDGYVLLEAKCTGVFGYDSDRDYGYRIRYDTLLVPLKNVTGRNSLELRDQCNARGGMNGPVASGTCAKTTCTFGFKSVLEDIRGHGSWEL